MNKNSEITEYYAKQSQIEELFDDKLSNNAKSNNKEEAKDVEEESIKEENKDANSKDKTSPGSEEKKEGKKSIKIRRKKILMPI